MDYYDLMLPLGLLSYLIPIVFISWFLISFIKIQKERNSILRDLSLKLDNKKKKSKGE
jgi:hypothetical protein